MCAVQTGGEPCTVLYCTVLYCTELRVCVQYKLEASPTPSDEEEESSDEEDAFGPKKEKVEEDPVKSKALNVWQKIFYLFILFSLSLGAKQMAEKAMNDPMAMVNNVSSLKFW